MHGTRLEIFFVHALNIGMTNRDRNRSKEEVKNGNERVTVTVVESQSNLISWFRFFFKQKNLVVQERKVNGNVSMLQVKPAFKFRIEGFKSTLLILVLSLSLRLEKAQSLGLAWIQKKNPDTVTVAASTQLQWDKTL